MRQSIRLLKLLIEKVYELYNENFLKASSGFLYIVATVHVYLFLEGWRSTATIETLKFDPSLTPFRPSAYQNTQIESQDFLSLNDYRLQVIILTLGTVILSATLATTFLRIGKQYFKVLLTFASILALLGLTALIFHYSQVTPEIRESALWTIFEPLGWFLIVVGLVFNGSADNQLREPIIMRELGVIFVTVASIYYTWMWSPKPLVIVIAFLICFAITIHWIKLIPNLNRMRYIQMDLNILRSFFFSNLIGLLSLFLSVPAILIAWQGNRIIETSGYPHIQIAGSRFTQNQKTSPNSDVLICRQEIIIDNVGGSATSITEVDTRVDVGEPPLFYSDAEFRTLGDTEIRILKEMLELPSSATEEETIDLFLRRKLFSFVEEFLGTHSVNSTYPAYVTTLKLLDKGLGAIFVWSTSAPQLQDISNTQLLHLCIDESKRT